MTHLLDTIDRLASVQVLVLGDVMLDRYWWGSVTRISPEAPVPVVKLGKTTLSAGGAANVAVNVAGLGAKALLCGAVGIDEGGELLLDVLRSKDVSVDHIVRTQEQPTTVKTRVVAAGQQIARIDQEAAHVLSEDLERALVADLATAIDDCSVIIVSDYAKGLLSDSLLRSIIGISRNAGKPLLVDPKGRQYGKYRSATMITPNRHEAAEACGLDELEPGMVETAGRKLLEEYDLEAVMVTRGDEGMTLFRRQADPVQFSASARTVYDVTGAGDTVIATLAACLGAGCSLEDGATLANLAAGLVVEQAGTTTVTAEQLRQAVRDSESA